MNGTKIAIFCQRLKEKKLSRRPKRKKMPSVIEKTGLLFITLQGSISPTTLNMSSVFMVFDVSRWKMVVVGISCEALFDTIRASARFKIEPVWLSSYNRSGETIRKEKKNKTMLFFIAL